MTVERLEVMECVRCGHRTPLARRRCPACASRETRTVDVDSTATTVAWTHSHLGGPDTFAVVRFLDGLVPVAVAGELRQELRIGARVRLSNREQGGLEAGPHEERGA